MVQEVTGHDYNGIPTAVITEAIWMPADGYHDNYWSVTVQCPYCNNKHHHGYMADGHRRSHCSAGTDYWLIDPDKLTEGQ